MRLSPCWPSQNGRSPSSPCYHQRRVTYFPWSKPVPLTAGDRVSVTLQANLVNEDYIWRWESRVFAWEDPDRVRYNFKQSTFYGCATLRDRQTISTSPAAQARGCYVPQLNPEANPGVPKRESGNEANLRLEKQRPPASKPSRYSHYPSRI
ncbi:MAG: hypothetical protein EBE86_011040 [Hormoscilla sp. GUM202]|nr:hypothetical protein [Hormoscilla sp. GUM202]